MPKKNITRKQKDNESHFLLTRFSVKFLRRAMFFFTTATFVFFMLYALGNYKGFLDSTQIMLLRLVVGVSSLSFLFSLATLILQVYYFFRRKHKIYLFQSITSFFCVVFCIGMAVLCTTIIIISRL